MDPKFEILLLQFEQPEKSVWDEILSFAEKWNQTKENKFINDEPSELAIYFSKEDNRELKELENILEQKHEEWQWAWIKTITNDPTKEEIEAQDYIQIIGDGYPDEFFLNEWVQIQHFIGIRALFAPRRRSDPACIRRNCIGRLFARLLGTHDASQNRAFAQNAGYTP